MLDITDLHPYQSKCVEWILDHPKCALFLDMGLGKTITTLTAINELMYTRLEINKVLIIAPLRVARDTWVDEIEQWAHVRHLSTSLVLGTPRQRSSAIRRNADVYITNRDNVKWLTQCYTDDSWDFDCVVIDELSSFKSPKSQRFKALKRMITKCKRVIGLTGTPTSNGLEDLWSQIYLLDQGERLGKTLTTYRQSYFYAIQMSNFVLYKPRQGALQQVTDKITDICLSMRASDYLQMVPVRHIQWHVTLDDNVMRRYTELKEQMIVNLPPDKVAVADNAAVLANKLKQFAGGAVYDDEGNVTEIHAAKIDALKELLEQADDNVLIAYEYRHELQRLQEAIPEAVLLGEGDTLRRWSAGEIRVGLANAQSLGHGLNIQRGGSIIVWYTLPWSLEIYQQFNARLYRQGQTKPVRIYHLVARDTIDTHVLEVLRGKRTTQSAIIDAVRAELHY